MSGAQNGNHPPPLDQRHAYPCSDRHGRVGIALLGSRSRIIRRVADDDGAALTEVVANRTAVVAHANASGIAGNAVEIALPDRRPVAVFMDIAIISAVEPEMRAYQLRGFVLHLHRVVG